MGEPIRINYGSLAEVGSPAELAALTSDGRHLVLRFPSLSGAEKAALIPPAEEKLAAAQAAASASQQQVDAARQVVEALRTPTKGSDQAAVEKPAAG